jgi:hypothetical protein
MRIRVWYVMRNFTKAGLQILRHGNVRQIKHLTDIARQIGEAGNPATTEGCPPGKARLLTQLTGPSYKGESFAPCRYLPDDPTPADFYRAHYASAWDSLNAKRGFPWSSNPWVYAITFEKVKP